jgi:Ca2+-binding EF-hand superfamily protein
MPASKRVRSRSRPKDSLANTVGVDSSQRPKVSLQTKGSPRRRTYKDIFDEIDDDSSGMISKDELESWLQKDWNKNYFPFFDLFKLVPWLSESFWNLEELFEEGDSDSDGMCSYQIVFGAIILPQNNVL